MGPISDCSEAMMLRLTYSDVKKLVASWPRGLVVLAVLLFAVLLVLWLLGQIALGGQVTLVQILTGLLVLAGLYWTSRRVVATEDNVRVAEEGHITERFTRAIAQLGDDKMAIRLGGIYALERLAKDSEKDHGPIMEVLTAYVREKAPRPEEDLRKAPNPPPTDIRAILTVIGRLETTDKNRGTDRLDLSHTQLFGADLEGANLRGAWLIDVDLSGAFLSMADLTEADLTEADLTEAFLPGTKLTGANLDLADLRGARHLTAEQIQSARSCYRAALPDYLPDSVKDLTDLLPDPPVPPVPPA